MTRPSQEATILQWDDDKLDELLTLAAERMIAAAVTLQTEHMSRLNESAGPTTVKRVRNTVAGPRGSSRTVYTNPSRPGEYLRKRTGFHQASLIATPLSVSEVLASGRIRIGYLANNPYGPHWETTGGRKGLLETLDEMRGQLGQIIQGG